MEHTSSIELCLSSEARIASLLHARLWSALHAHSATPAHLGWARTAAKMHAVPPAVCTSCFCTSPQQRLASAAQPSCCTLSSDRWRSIARHTSCGPPAFMRARRVLRSAHARLATAEQPSTCTAASARCVAIASATRPMPSPCATTSKASSPARLAIAAQPRRCSCAELGWFCIARHTRAAPPALTTDRRHASPSCAKLAIARQPSSSIFSVGCVFIAIATRDAIERGEEPATSPRWLALCSRGARPVYERLSSAATPNICSLSSVWWSAMALATSLPPPSLLSSLAASSS
mmetsp:Transcript_67253/g.162529  ORF Transcript_67253/g.162529 Transcript_67253/m.162529 type:complete len:291 (-) Transcript_67253:2118-2990(-)